MGLVLATNSNNNCAGSLTAHPPGPSTPGPSVTFKATPSSGLVFAQWDTGGALTGSTNPSTVQVNQEEFVQADFNTISTPLTITSLSPSSVGAGAGPFTLTVNGTGFTPPPTGGANTGGYAYVLSGDSYYYRTLTYVSPTQVQIGIQASDVANPGAVVFVIEMAARRKVVLFSSHGLEAVERVCTHVVILHWAKIVADDSIARLRTLMSLPTLEEIFAQFAVEQDTAAVSREIADLILA